LGTLKTYRIDLKKLSPSEIYTFDYVLDNAFFESVNGPEVRQGDVNVSLAVTRISSTFELEFHLSGRVVVTCDRCLEEMHVPVETINRLIVTFGNKYAETSDEQVTISEEEGFIHVAWYMYEFIALAIPMKHVHEPGECNEAMDAKLKEICVDELKEGEIISEPTEGDRPIDPRWDALRNIQNER
jgi:uncharacterized metal-binding protein YceD (DUF177 family)